jgi:hypothetical protein
MRSASRAILIIAIAMLATWTATAGGDRKVIVLPLGGDADDATRNQLTQQVVRLARANGGTVTTGTTTFAETAAAVGCDPAAPACGDTVIGTLNVDEVVFGTATTSGGQTTVAVSRLGRGGLRKDQTVTVDSADKAEGELRPLFGGVASAPGSGTPTVGIGSAGSDLAGSGSGVEPTSFFDTRERKLGVGFLAGGGIAMIIGFALWASESSLQAQIDSAPNQTSANIAALRALEDRASNYAWSGNALVFVGLAAAGIGAYYLWTDHKARASATVVPAGETGATIVVGGRW